MTPPPEDLGRLAYNTYAKATHFKNFLGQELPPFDDLPERTRAAWESAAQTIWKLATSGRLVDDPCQWMTSARLKRLLGEHRDNDVKVNIGGMLVPIAELTYWRTADCLVLELVDGEDLAVALTPTPDLT